MSKLSAPIARKKEILIKRAQKKGIYEDFGQKEVEFLKKRYCYDWIKYGTVKEREMANELVHFDNWCMCFDLSNLK